MYTRLMIFSTLCAMTVMSVASAATGIQEQPAIYGADNRQEPFEISDADIRAIGQESVVALMSAYRLSSDDPRDYIAPEFRFSSNLCSDEAFGRQPLSSFCSGVVIAPDLVLTAGHCFTDPERQCARTRMVFNYAYNKENTLERRQVEDIYGCERIVTRSKATDLTGIHDWMILQLDRAVDAPHKPAQLRPSLPVDSDAKPASMNIGQQVIMFGFPMGLPLKVRANGTVTRPGLGDNDVYVTDLDAFTGDSGAGVWTKQGDDYVLTGILISGDDDFVDSHQGEKECKRTKKCTALTCIGENVLYVEHPIRDLCATRGGKRIHHELCGDEGPSCGDGHCDARERDGDDTCSQDCGPKQVATCGDGVCEHGEIASCPIDCEMVAPLNSGCDASNFGTFDGCHACDVPDPDCDIEGAEDKRPELSGLFGCAATSRAPTSATLLWMIVGMLWWRRRRAVLKNP